VPPARWHAKLDVTGGAIVIVAAYGVLAESSAVADNIDNAKKC